MEKPEAEKNKEKQRKADEITLPRKEYDELVKRIEELESLREKFLRSAADYDNARKRLAKEREEFVRFSQERLLRDLLPVLDNFERALSHSESSEKDAPRSSQGMAAGVQLIWKQLLDILTAHGLQRLSAEGQPFNPHYHEAVGQVMGEGPEGIVVREIAPGYLLNDRVLRPAKVQVRIRPAGKEKMPEEKEEEIT